MLMHPRIEQLRSRIRAAGGIEQVECIRRATSSRTTAPILHDMIVHDAAILLSLDEDIPWRVTFAVNLDAIGEVGLKAGKRAATLTADRAADRAERILRVYCRDETLEWDQLDPDDPDAQTLVTRRLSLFADAIRGDDTGNLIMQSRVAELLEAAA
jgi:hypothetical protein